MSQQKAASLTSSLFARKGRASPASMVISELDDGAANQPSPEAPQNLHDRHEGGELKLSALALNGQSGRRKTKTESELPLLAFVEAQLAAEDIRQAPADCAADTAAESKADEVPLAKAASDGERPPAASLLDRGTRALGKGNGRHLADDAATQPAADLPVDVAARVETESEVNGSRAADSPSSSDPDAQRETIPGDQNVAAIEDAPREDAPEEAGTGEKGSHAEPGKEPAGQPDARDSDWDAGAPAADSEGTAQVASSADAPSEVQQANAAENSSSEIAVTPSIELKVTRDAAISASLAMRNAAALRAERKEKPGLRAVAVAAPPQAAEKGLPWRSAAVLALGLVLGLGAYVMLSEVPRETAVQEAGQLPEPLPNPLAEAPQAATTPGAETKVLEAVAEPERVALEAAVPQPEPSFDIIRIEPDGQSIIAGRATPFSEWILLNNGAPIASIQADANGEWVVLPDASLVPGANAFSLVPKAEQGRVSIPAPVEAAPATVEPDGLSPRSDLRPEPAVEADSTGPATASAAPDSAPVALPKPKPDARMPVFRASEAGSYQVQVASVRDSGDAERERLRLTAAYPNLLGSLELKVQEAAVEGSGIFYRVRSGAMANLGDAREVCRLLEAAGQGCLVVRRAPDVAQPAVPETPTEVVRETTPASLPPSRQQAERPQ